MTKPDLVDCSGECGSSGTGETPQASRAEEAHRQPRGKRASWGCNQPCAIPIKKQQSLRKLA